MSKATLWTVPHGDRRDGSADDRSRVEDLQAGRDEIRRHLDRLIHEMLSSAARRRGKNDASVIAVVPDPQCPHEPVNSL
ncbi:MAG: hypothetical protein QOI71_2042 [Gaiellales bacterium]|jgi:hypothetical protein|nr:hypothetical protein [Gaiellales bacterium]